MNWSHILIRTYFFGVILNVEMGNVYQLYHWNYHFCPRTQVKWWVNDLSHLLCCPTSRVCVEIHEQRFRNSEIKWSQHGTGYMLPFLFKDIMKIHVFVVRTPTAFFGIPLPCCVFRWDWRWMHTYPIFLVPGAKVPSCDPVVFDGSQWLLAARPFLQYNSERTCELWTIHHPKMALE